jgi:TolB protein
MTIRPKSFFYIFLLSLLGICGFQSPAYAALVLELTQGIDSAIPIAVVPFKSAVSKELSANLTEVMTQDLHNSGDFRTLDTQNMPQKPSQLSEVNWPAWKEAAMDYLVVGNIRLEGVDHYRVNVQLFNVYKAVEEKTVSEEGSATTPQSSPSHQGSELQKKSMMLNESYVVPEKDLRRLAHKIADQIYEKILGVPGVFSTKIAYVLEQMKPNHVRQYSLLVADADGNHPQSVLTSTQPIMSPAWLPNGREIAYVSFEKTRASIYLSNIVTGQRRLLSQSPGINGAPAFSKDGEKLALVLSKTGEPKIYIMDLNTKQLEQMTTGWSIDTEPDWSSDGKKLLFTSDRAGGPQIYQLDVKTKAIQRLTYDGNYNARASFTPDGQHMAMLHRDDWGYNIAMQDLNSGALTFLSRSSDNQSPRLSPNGRMVIFASQEGNKGILNIASVDGRTKLRLPENEGSVREPVWGPIYNN